MSGSKPKGHLAGTCSHCGGRLEFPVELIGTMAECPHCRRQTELLLETPVADDTGSRKAIVWTVIGVVILILGLGVPMWGLRWAGQHRQQLGPRIAPGLEASALTVEKSGDGPTLYVAGTLANNFDRRRVGIQVLFHLFDATGKMVGSGSAYQPVLDPGAQAQFKVSVEAPQATSARVVSIKEGQTQP